MIIYPALNRRHAERGGDQQTLNIRMKGLDLSEPLR
jgi:hypothetical protein